MPSLWKNTVRKSRVGQQDGKSSSFGGRTYRWLEGPHNHQNGQWEDKHHCQQQKEEEAGHEEESMVVHHIEERNERWSYTSRPRRPVTLLRSGKIHSEEYVITHSDRDLEPQYDHLPFYHGKPGGAVVPLLLFYLLFVHASLTSDGHLNIAIAHKALVFSIN